jgi:ABC-type antimicrobial peptide transport system permease subunit
MGIPIVQGRAFTNDDGPGHQSVIILSKSAVRAVWSDGRNPIGQRVRVVKGRTEQTIMEVVGVVGDLRVRGPDSEPTAQVYVPFQQDPPLGNVYFAIKTAGDPATLTTAVRTALQERHPDVPVYQVRSLEDIIGRYLAERRFASVAGAVFALLALVLAAVGLAGLLGHLVERRRAEIGVRMALGADAGRVRRGVILAGTRLAVAGTPLGIVGAWLLGRAISRLVVGAVAIDWATVAGTAAFVIGLSALAAFIPAQRATRVDPLVALREP